MLQPTRRDLPLLLLPFENSTSSYGAPILFVDTRRVVSSGWWWTTVLSTRSQLRTATLCLALTDWDRCLFLAQFAINNAWHETVQQTPFFLNHGRAAKTPLESFLPMRELVAWLPPLLRLSSPRRTSASGESRTASSFAGRRAVWQGRFPTFSKSGLTPAMSPMGASCCPRLTWSRRWSLTSAFLRVVGRDTAGLCIPCWLGKIWADKHPVSDSYQSKPFSPPSLLGTCNKILHPATAATSNSGYSKFACASSTPSAPDWLWAEHRRLLPIAFAEIQALLGRAFTLYVAVPDSSDNAHCANFCSPSNSFMSREHVGHMWVNAPFSQLASFLQHYLHC